MNLGGLRHRVERLESGSRPDSGATAYLRARRFAAIGAMTREERARVRAICSLVPAGGVMRDLPEGELVELKRLFSDALTRVEPADQSTTGGSDER